MTKENNKNRVFVKAFNKYLDELTTEEWEMAVNTSCGLSDNSKPNC